VQSDIDEAKAAKKTGDGKTDKRRSNAINVTDSGQLLLLLKGATPAPGQKMIVTPDKAADSIRENRAKPPAELPKPKAPQPLGSVPPPDRR
jgi:hypothetical protein